MTTICKGCGEDMTSVYPALSRYGHGNICPDCGTTEAFKGDFITKYFDPNSPDTPKEALMMDIELQNNLKN